ncbi:MAG: hypothetical protein ACMG6S_32785 [Byssovorax sp.]
MNTRTLLLAGLTAASVAVLIAPEARADSVIKQPSRHPVYRAELEPHINILPWHRNYGRYGNYKGVGDFEFGGGFRASIELADPAFIPKINNTVAITFGVDFTNCRYCGNRDFSFWSPVELQWNFFLTDKWSVFAEGGVMLHSYGFLTADTYGDFTFSAGARYHFDDKVALTMRLGYPFVSVGVSFFVGH